VIHDRRRTMVVAGGDGASPVCNRIRRTAAPAQSTTNG
jgi:hypothetical protein